jgi:FecR protein
MNKYFGKSASGAFAVTSLLFSFLLLQTQSASAAPHSARVTQVIRDVKLVPSNTTPRPAAINDDVREGTAVRTGQDSRTELTFTDRTLTRLGANSIFSFNIGAGTFDLGQGSILMQVPPNGSSVKIKTAAVTAAITGGTAIFGTGPPTKFMVLEGTGTFYPAGHPEEAVTLHGGEMVTLTPDGHLVGPAKFDIKLVLATSELVTSFPDLANLPLILAVIREQEAEFATGSSTPPPKDPTEVVDQKNAASTPSPSPSASPTGTPSKFGAPSTISSPNPYVINSGTQIQTDPSITTNGVTDYGKIWRGHAIDGALSAFVFGSTSSFDTTSGFDAEIEGNNNNGGAGFKFTSLQLTGDPIISTLNGEINLGLIAVDGITSGGPGGTLTFAGIRGMLLATQNGSINLGPEISFSGLHDITLYARGAGSNLIISSAISTSSEIHLFSQGNIQISGTLTTNDFTAFSGGDLNIGQTNQVALNFSTATLHADNNVNWNIEQTTLPGNISSLSVTAGNALNFTGGNSDTPIALTLNLTADSTFTAGTGGINAPFVNFTNSGANLNFISAGSITAYSITHPGNASGTIAANGGALTLTGDLTSGNVSALTNIDIGGNVIVGSLTATNGTITVGGSLGVFGAITAGSDITAGTVEVSAGGITTPGNLTAGSGGIHPFIVSPGGATQQNFASVATVISPNGIDFSGNQFGGIDGHASGGILTLNVSSANFDPSSGIGIVNFNGADAGATDGNGNVFTSVGGNGGTFIANATGDITVTSGSPISATTGQIDPNLSSATSSGAGGTVELNSSNGAVSVDSTIQVSSAEPTSTIAPFRSSASGGNIKLTSGKTSGVAINVTSSAQLLSLLNAAAPGPGGKITILASAPNNSGNNSTINIDNSNGLIAADGTGGTVDIEHQGDSGTININNANIRADVVKVGAFGANGTLNISGGAINADTMLKLYAPGSNGHLNFLANVTLSSNTAATLAANTITIQPRVVVNIAGTGGPANVYTNHPDYNFTPGSGYTGPAGNPSNGSFGGNGAHDPQPLLSAPTF